MEQNFENTMINTPDSRPNDGYYEFERQVAERAAFLINNVETPLFKTNADGLYESYLANIPEEARQHYTCFACNNFIERFGSLVKGDIAEAEKYMKKGLEITKVLAEQTKDRQTKQYLAASYLKMGDVCLNYRMGNIQEILNYYEKCCEIREALAEDTCTAEARRDLSFIYNRLGALLQKLTQMKEAALKQSAEKEKKRKVLAGKIFGNVLKGKEQEYKNELLEIKNLLLQAKFYFEKSRELCEQYAEEVDTPEAKLSLAVCYNRLGDLSMQENGLSTEKDFCKAKEYNEKYMELCEAVVKDQKMEKTMRELYISYQKYGETLHHMGDAEKAKSYYKRGHVICEELAKQSESPDRKADLAVSYYRLESVYPGRGYQKKAIEICEELCRRYPEVDLYRTYLHIFKG